MRYLIILLALLATAFASAQPASPQAEKRQYLVAIARDMRVAQSFKYGINAEKARSGSISEQAQAVLRMDDKRLEVLFADVLESKVSLQEAREAYDFHGSDAGRALIAAQAKDPLNAGSALNLTSAQIAAVNAYMSSPTGKKLGALVSDSATWNEFSAKVADDLVRP